MLIAVELSDPVNGPMRPEEKTGEQQGAAREHARARGVSGGDRQPDLRLGDGERECDWKEGAAHDERRPLRGQEGSPIRIGKKDQQATGILPDQSKRKESGTDAEK